MSFAFEAKTVASEVIKLGVNSRGLLSWSFQIDSLCKEAKNFLWMETLGSEAMIIDFRIKVHNRISAISQRLNKVTPTSPRILFRVATFQPTPRPNSTAHKKRRKQASNLKPKSN